MIKEVMQNNGNWNVIIEFFLIMGLFENFLSAFFIYIAVGIIMVDVVDYHWEMLCRK